jgi:hypothetical protein
MSSVHGRESVATFAIVAASLLIAIVARPLHAQSFGCAPNSPSTDTNANLFLDNDNATARGLKQKVNSVWGSSVTKIDPIASVATGNIVTSCPSNGGAACFFDLSLTTCEHVTTQFTLSAYKGLGNITGISSLTVGSFNPKDVATHGLWGPDASMVTDGVFAPEGDSWNNVSFTVILPLAGEGSAISIDLGSTMTVCGTSACGPFVQADRHNMELDWWDEGNQKWQVWGGTCESSGSGLISRKVIPSSTPGTVKCGTSTSGSNFTTRYVRLWALSGADDSDFSVSEIQLKDPGGNIISTGKQATGPRPYQITDGITAKEGTTWNNKNYAVVLRYAGPGNALVIDLGGNVQICGSGTCVPQIQADKNVYGVDYSLDGVNWVTYAQLPAVSDTGLQTRPLPANGNFTARYVRIWGCAPSECSGSGDTNFSVSEVTLFNTSGSNVSKNALTFGPERVATNGEPKPNGGDWYDARYSMILSPCLSSAKYPCNFGVTTKTAAVYIDLTASFSLSKMDFQADRHQFQIDYYDDGAQSWKSLWTVPSNSQSGLSTRSNTFSTPLKSARHLRIYGTDFTDSDVNYSLATVKVYTSTANTACAYDSAANSGATLGQAFACTYDAAIAAALSTSAAGIPIQFTIDSADTHLRCTNGTVSGNDEVANFPDNTTCTAMLKATNVAGSYCSGLCSSGDYVATSVDIAPTLELTNLKCSSAAWGRDQDTADQFTAGLVQFVQSVAQQAVGGLFDGVVRSPKVTPTNVPWIPSGACATTLETSNTTLEGLATQVGSNNDNGHVQLSGEASISDSTRLDAVALTLEQVLFERGGVEELVRDERRNAFVRPKLELQKGSTPDRARYATAPSQVPSVRAALSRTKAGSMAFDIQIDRVTMPTLPNCSGAPPAAVLSTRFTLDDGANSTTVRARQGWLCKGNQLSTP